MLFFYVFHITAVIICLINSEMKPSQKSFRDFKQGINQKFCVFIVYYINAVIINKILHCIKTKSVGKKVFKFVLINR